jgi:hypothetical protein
LTAVFFLPAHAISAIWIALSLKSLSLWAKNSLFLGCPRSARIALGLSGAFLSVVPTFLHFGENDESQTYLAEDWGRNILETLKPNSIILPSADHSTFPLLYLQKVEGLRPDVLVGDKYGYIEDRVLRDLFRGKDTPRVPPPIGGTPFEKERYIVEHSGRPVYFTTKSRIPNLENHELRTKGLIFEAVTTDGKPEEEEHKAIWGSFHWHKGSLAFPPGDFSKDLILSDYHYARGRYALLFSRDKEALEALRLSEVHGFGIKEIHNNLGGTLAEGGKPELSIPFLKNALAIEPEYDLAIKNMANVLFALKRYREGLSWFERMLRLEPENPIGLLGKARAHKEMGEKTSAFFAYLHALRRDPRSETLRSEAREFTVAAYGKDSRDLRWLEEEMESPPAVKQPEDESSSLVENPGQEGEDDFQDDPSRQTEELGGAVQ